MVFEHNLIKSEYEITTEQVISSITEGIIVTDISGKIIYLNESAQGITGWMSEEAIGQEIEDVFDLVNIKTGKKLVSPVIRAIEEKTSVGLENNTVLFSKHGNIKYVSASVSPIFVTPDCIKGVTIVLRDITKFRSKEVALEEEKEYYTSLFEGFPTPVWICDTDGYYRYFNRTWLEFTGGSYEEEENRGWLSRVYEEDYKERERVFTEYFNSQEPFAFEFRLKNRDGIYTWVIERACPLYGNRKNFIGFLGSCTDISMQKKAEEEIIRARNTAEAAYKSKSQFLANMSHEIRTPINGIIGMTELTMLTELTSEQRENLTIVKTCASSLLNIINDILDSSKIEAGKFNIINIQFNLRELVEKTVKIHLNAASSKGYKITTDIRIEDPYLWYGDPNRIQQVLNNLLSNAVKFTQKGQIEVTLELYKNLPDFSEFLFKVKDTGIGIAQGDMDKLFKPFSQVDGSYTRRYGGTGLGLSISKQLVELMGGSIWAESEKGKGSEFSFTIRLAKDEHKLETCILEEKVLNTDEIRGSRILLAEDDQANQVIVKKIADLAGLEIDIVNNGFEAVAMAKGKPYDLILMDIQMPEMDGIQACDNIREYEKPFNRHTPIIAISAHALTGDKEMLLSRGMDGFLPKPFQINELIEIMLDSIKKENNNYKNEKNNQEELNLNENAMDYYAKLIAAINEKNEIDGEKYANLLKELELGENCEELRYCAFRILLDIRKGDFIKAESLCGELYENIKKCLSENHI